MSGFQFLPPAHSPPGLEPRGAFFSAVDNAGVTPSTPTPIDPAPEPALQQPSSLSDLFISLSVLALQGFGGVLGVVQRELVERKRWMTREQFVEDWAVAQIMPGPNVVNFSLMLGNRYFGLRGSLVALAGILTLPLVVVVLLALLYVQYGGHPQVAGAVRGMGAAASGLVTATGLKLLPVFRTHPLGRTTCMVLAAGTFVAVGLLGWPLVGVLAVMGGAGCILTWRKLGASAA